MNTERGIFFCAAALLAAAVLPAAAGDRVEICPQIFDAGGWKLDVQFMDVIGSPYLLAHGAGMRVTDAKASVAVPESGKWRVWVRSRKWTDGAGAFRVSVGGAVLEKTFGVSQSGWDWEDGGDVELEKGRAEIRLADCDGFDGRCAGVVLEKDGVRPEGALSPASAAMDEELDFDFVVVGGGVPGTCAAVAAARRGLKVALVQDRPVLGGNASSEIRVWSAGEAKYPLVRELRGWFMNRDPGMELSDAHRLRIAEDEKTLSVFLRHRVFAAEAVDGMISSVKALDWGRNRVVRFKAPLFCDATGDGWLGFYAGADWRMGREAKGEYGESFAPEKPDGHTLGASLMWKSSAANTDIPFSAPWAEPHAQGVSAVNGEWNWEYGIRRDMIEEGEAVRDRLLLAVYGAFSLAKKDPANSKRVIDTLPFLLGKRESRRLMGDWVYSEKDVTEKRLFEDAIAAGSWSVDLHYDDCKPGVDFLTTCRQPHFGRYWIPYRSIYSRNVRNLFMAGRCFSCTHVGLGGPRVINTLSQLGCAAGEAAAICRERGILPRDVWKRGLVRELQDRLGGEFPGRPDPALAGWAVIDDETPGVEFGDGWKFHHFANGEQVGEGAHCPPGGSGWGCVIKQGVKCGDAVYPLPVAAPGRYALMGRVPYLPGGATEISETAMSVESGGRKTGFKVNQAVEMGTWRRLGVFDLAPGAKLRIVPSASRGTIIADGFAIVPVKPVDLVSYVDPMIGSVTFADGKQTNIHGFGKTFPGAATPFGMVQLSPDTITGGDNGSGYSYTHDTIEGFSFLHMSGVGWYGEFGNFQVMVGGNGPSRFSHSNETAEAGYYRVRLDDAKALVEATATPDAGLLRFTFEEGGEQTLTIDLARRIGEISRAKPHGRQTFEMEGRDAFKGSIVCDHRDGGWGRGAGKVDYTVYFRGIVSKPFSRVEKRGGDTNMTVVATLPASAGESVAMKVAISFDAIPPRPDAQDFDVARADAKRLWKEAFDVIEVEGGTERERTIFATALYHAFLDPRSIGRGDGYMRRTVFSGWDVFRSEMPLLCLVRPDVVRDTILSMMDVVKRGDRDTLPVWDVFGCKSGCMIGNPIIPVMATAVQSGITNFDVKAMYEMAKETSAKRGNAPCGFAPGSLSETLEYCYDDWCMLKLAERYGTPDDVRHFAERAKWYTNCWDRSVGWFRTRNADGSWLEPWQGRTRHGQGCVESNPWQQGWFVPHDPEGLAALMGGRESCIAELERFFCEAPPDFLWNDAYNHPNEPVHHAAALFATLGRPDLAEKWTRKICANAYGTGPYGLCGNDDVGQMSAWYVLAAIGRLPLDPAAGVWHCVTPMFDRVRLKTRP